LLNIIIMIQIFIQKTKTQYREQTANVWGEWADHGSSGKLTTDLITNMSGGKTFGIIPSGTTIPAGTSLEALIRQATVETINPSATVSVSGSIEYNPSDASLSITMTKTINNPGATVSAFVLSYRRGTDAWVELFNDDVALLSFTHNSDVGIAAEHRMSTLLAANSTKSFSYQLIVTDSLGATVTVTSNAITPAGYSAPSTNIAVSGTRERGNVDTNLVGTISQTAQNGVSITSRKLQFSLDNIEWIDLATGELSNSINYTATNSELVDNDILYFRLSVVCSTPTGDQTTNLPLGSISFVYKNAFGYSATATGITLATLLAMGNNSLTNAKAKTVVATAPSGQYTYYAYCAAAGDLASVTIGAETFYPPQNEVFTKQADITGVNSFGAYLTYRVYRSNATKAFTNHTLNIV